MGRNLEHRKRELKLLTAMPGVLSSLRELIELAEGFDDADRHEDDEEPIVAPILERARAALAKAEGK